ncbi:uncharacterized protein LOC135206856 [Macrobrachium nipponense]|uniref:uncharacterized protein LOC135206856 n=1 Tax=Macrobrachium nipponense TaxID=159736 RepID=UPI0030C87B6F
MSGRVAVLSGPGELVKIDGRFTGENYIEILEQVFLPTVRAMAVPAPGVIKLVHDQSPIHNSHVVGCDLNPIEHLWAMMVRELNVGEQRTRQAEETKAYVMWVNVRRRPQLCMNLVDSVPARLCEVTDADGGWTSYSLYIISTNNNDKISTLAHMFLSMFLLLDY